ncbi:MAG TPA: ABC transporter ATP-binding protein [Acidobacteriota bacterium]|nr:ABC transporter ATP-binding protein [Acidobacteriota bacterium]
MNRETCLEVNNLTVRFRSATAEEILAVDGVSFTVRSGEVFGLVGESGCGKTTLAHCILRLLRADSGRIRFQGLDWSALEGKELRRQRRRIQMIFQDPATSLNPRMTVGQLVAEPLWIHRLGDNAGRSEKAIELLETVGLQADDASRKAAEFSGGQRQRIAIARALALEPELLIADEPVSSLDRTAQGEILELLDRMQSEFQLTTLFITHNLKLVRKFCQRVAVMFHGRLVEIAETETLFEEASHPYTKVLLGTAGPDSPV